MSSDHCEMLACSVVVNEIIADAHKNKKTAAILLPTIVHVLHYITHTRLDLVKAEMITSNMEPEAFVGRNIGMSLI